MTFQMEGSTMSPRPEENQPFLPPEAQLSIVVPAFQEAPNLPRLAAELSDVLDKVIPSWELIIVDDDSRDGSYEICRELAFKGMPIKLIIRTNVRGLSSAVVEGFAHARAPIIVVMDADLSHPATAIPELYYAISDGVEFAMGSRYVPGGSTDDRWSAYRWLNSKVASLLARPLVSLRDPTAGFFALPRSLLQRCEALDPIGYKIALEILIKSRARNIREIPIHFRTRQFGKSKLKVKQQLLYLRHLYSLYRFKFFQSYAPQKPAEAVTPHRSVQFHEKEKVS